jgi:hypothetical protein
MKAEILRVDGTRELVKGTFEEVRDLCGCETFAVVRLPGKRILLCDEDAQMRKRPVNVAATLLFLETGASYPLLGDVALCDAKELK